VFAKTKLPPILAGPTYGVLRAFAIGAGAVVAGGFVGFLVNGPPQRPLEPRTAAGEVAAAPRPSGDTVVAATPAVEAMRPIPPLPEVEAREPAAPQALAPGLLVFAEVRELQRLLRAAGFNPGPLDGSAGPTTAHAARQYQHARGLAVTGEIDNDLLARLREERTSAPSPPRRSYATAKAPPRQRNNFLDSIDRLFRRL
jgi:hypothetical protein